MKHKVLVVGSDIVWNICNIWLHSIVAFLLNLCVNGMELDEKLRSLVYMYFIRSVKPTPPSSPLRPLNNPWNISNKVLHQVFLVLDIELVLIFLMVKY